MDALFSAPILFFALGGAIALAGARIPVPDGFAKALAAYLLVAIGLKGGAALSGAQAGMVAPLLATAAALSFTMPFLGFALLRRLAGVDRVNAAAIAAHYGSVSLVTFVTATRMLESQGIGFGGYMAAALAVMEGPAIVSGLLLAGLAGTVRAGGDGTATVALGDGGGTVRAALREAALNGSVLLLAGSLLVGLLIGKPGLASLHGLFIAPWEGVLCLFLLEMGYMTAARLREAARLGPRLIAFGLVMPPVGAVIGLGAAMALGLQTGDAALLMTLCASASYIAVPAALQHALPTADPGLSLPLALGITFPVNILAGIPLYVAMASAAVG